MLSVQIRELRTALKSFKAAGQVHALIEAVRKLRNLVTEPESAYGGKAPVALRPEDLHLICFDFLSGG